MFTVLSIMFAGIAIGWLLRRQVSIRKIANHLILPVICLLLATMGASIGANKQVMQNLSSLGFQAIWITTGALAGSIFMAWIVYLQFFKKHHER